MNREQTIRKNHEFQAILKGKHISDDKLVLYFLPSKESMRVGISVSKKFLGAVGRNSQRRQVRAILDELNLWDKNINAVLILRKPFLNLSYQEKKNAIQGILERA